MNKICLPVIAMLLASPVAAQPVEAEISEKSAREDVFPQSEIAFRGDVVAWPQVEISNLDGFRPVRMDIYAPRDRSKARPAVLWIHGGGWSRGDARTSGAYANWPAVLASLAARGFVVASLDYRLSGEAKFPAQIQDVNAAIRHLRSQAGALGIDPSRVYLWGGSAGGHLASLAALTCGAGEYDPQPSTGRLSRSQINALKGSKAPPVDDCVQGAALWYGVFDLEHVPSVNVAGLLGCDPAACRDVARAASPLYRIGKNVPPMLLIHGTKDETVEVSQSKTMTAALRNVGAKAELLLIPDVDHGLTGNSPQITRDANLLALGRTFAFFESLAAGR
ncbi:MAG: alpha/beta hydrolase [Sphingopyxis sp.]|uniref:alpha/beta hydrolase n=1 Tax=Sphingopyxis sp. TaxID=1908224 RepID=UPI001A20D880|nr:alpha/beta hydrolase [Sphingopyxis sp.]MBJ7498340.1 alpha/beta hydrolase [Sphingopyxis sp.]